MTKAILFDLDETLLDRKQTLERFLADQFETAHPVLKAQKDAAIAYFLKLDDRGNQPKTIVYPKLLAHFGIEDDALSKAMFDQFESDHWRYALAYPDMMTVLLALKSKGFKLGMITNGPTHIQLRNILALNLDRVLDDYVISETEGLRKPDPAIFTLAAKRLEIAPEDCIFVGDTPQADMLGAHRTGMVKVWFPNGMVWDDALDFKADMRIDHLSQLLDYVAL